LGLTPGQYSFALQYLANGFNATRAYVTAHPGVTNNTAAVEGHRTLRHPKVRAFLYPQAQAIWRELQMGGEEALARVARDARADIRQLFKPGTKELLDPSEWPEEIAGSIKAVQDSPYGLKVVLVDPLIARRTILEQTGKLKTLPDSVDVLAAAIRADKERNKDIPA
jgi:phage terminase small subunit